MDDEGKELKPVPVQKEDENTSRPLLDAEAMYRNGEIAEGDPHDQVEVEVGLLKTPDGLNQAKNRRFKRRLSKAPEKVNNKLKDIREVLDLELTDIQNLVHKRRIDCRREIMKNEELTRDRDSNLKYLSSKNNIKRWKRLQSMMNFLRILYTTLRDARNFGMDPTRGNLLQKAKQKENERKSGVLYPDSRFMTIYLLLLAVICFTLTIFCPFLLAFTYGSTAPPEFWKYFDLSIGGLFLFDVVLNFFVVGRDHHFTFIDQKSLIAKNYLPVMAFDLIALFPYDQVITITDMSYVEMIKLYKLFKMLNMFVQQSNTKMMMRELYSKKFKQIFPDHNTIYVVWSIIMTIIFVHVGASIWCFMSYFNPTSMVQK